MNLSRLYVICVLILSVGCNSDQQRVSDDPTIELIKRIVGPQAESFGIEYIAKAGDRDVFELESRNGKIVLRGNDGVSIASAFNHYLKHFCNVEISWNNMSVKLPDDLPIIPGNIRITSPHRYRYYLNYCTFNYSMAWWDWERWQREIDWMALHGINMPLALTGEEAIWQDVYHQLGFSNKELETFFTGPSYFSWLWMGNIDAWGGPLPEHWIESHRELQKKILARERALGMTPVLPAFTGHVPPSFGEKFPNAKLHKTNWGAGFQDVYILDATDSLFDRVGAMFMETQRKQYGTDHFYSADTFNENVPPQSDSTFLSEISRKVYRSMADTDPDAVWLMQGWMFHYNADFWKPEKIEALLAGVPNDRMIILDLYSESHPVWTKTKAYYGKPWTWNMLQNFGGNISLFGRMNQVANGPSEALHSAQSGRLQGIGLTPEGIEQNPALFALMLENVWQDQPIDVDTWLTSYASRRYGKKNEKLRSAWNILKETVYDGGLTEGGPESIIVSRPTFAKEGHRVLTTLTYDNKELAKAWKLFIEVGSEFKNQPSFEYDLADLTRQVLANYATPLQQRVAKAYHEKNTKDFARYSSEFLTLIDDMDALLTTRQEFLLGAWLQDARAQGITSVEKDLYEFNARDLVTLWGDKNSELHEYSNRQWAGLLKTFYRPRWEQFFQYVSACMKRGSVVDEKIFENKIKEWEWDWVNQKDGKLSSKPSGSTVAVATALYEKYSEKIAGDGLGL